MLAVLLLYFRQSNARDIPFIFIHALFSRSVNVIEIWWFSLGWFTFFHWCGYIENYSNKLKAKSRYYRCDARCAAAPGRAAVCFPSITMYTHSSRNNRERHDTSHRNREKISNLRFGEFANGLIIVSPFMARPLRAARRALSSTYAFIQ